MAEMDLELATLFNLNDSPVQQPRCDDFVALDKAFESADFGIESASSQRDEDLQEISIDRANNRVIRKYRS